MAAGGTDPCKSSGSTSQQSFVSKMAAGVIPKCEVEEAGLFGKTYVKLSVPIKGEGYEGKRVDVYVDKGLIGDLSKVTAEIKGGKLVMNYEIQGVKKGVLETDAKLGEGDIQVITINEDSGEVYGCSENTTPFIKGEKPLSNETLVAIRQRIQKDTQAAKGSE